MGRAVYDALSLGRSAKHQVSLEGEEEKQEVGVLCDEEIVAVGDEKRGWWSSL